jgi:hypothetical protein
MYTYQRVSTSCEYVWLILPTTGWPSSCEQVWLHRRWLLYLVAVGEVTINLLDDDHLMWVGKYTSRGWKPCMNRCGYIHLPVGDHLVWVSVAMTAGNFDGTLAYEICFYEKYLNVIFFYGIYFDCAILLQEVVEVRRMCAVNLRFISMARYFYQR